MSKRSEKGQEHKPWKLLLWTALAGIVFGLIGFGEIAEDLLRTGRNSLHWHRASGDIVLVKIDNEAVREVGRWPWPRGYDAKLIDQITRSGAKRIFFDIGFYDRTDESDDRLLAQALKRSNRVVLAARTRAGPNAGRHEQEVPLPAFAAVAKVGTISWKYNYENAVLRIPYSAEVDGDRKSVV